MMRAVLLAIVLAGGAAMAGDPWDEHALSDDEAARMGREALPFTPEQIIALGRIFRKHGPPPAKDPAPGPKPASGASGSNRGRAKAPSRFSWRTATRRP